MEKDTERYIRQTISHPDFRQEKLAGAVVFIVGLGGLGGTAAMYLAAAGVGHMILCDHDTISVSNLNRQLLYAETEIGRKKVEVAAAKLSRINPYTAYTRLDEKFSRETLMPPPKPHLILDCLDNFQGRVDLAGFAFENNIPLIHGAIHGFTGQMIVFRPGASACPICIAPEDMGENHTVIPAVGACAGFIGSMQALEAIKYITGLGTLCTNRFMMFDGFTGRVEEISVTQDPGCRVCAGQPGRGEYGSHC